MERFSSSKRCANRDSKSTDANHPKLAATRPGASSTDGVALATQEGEGVPRAGWPIVVHVRSSWRRWSEETRSFHQTVGKGQVQGGTTSLAKESGARLAAQVWRDAVASSLLECRTAVGSDGATPFFPQGGRNFKLSGYGALSESCCVTWMSFEFSCIPSSSSKKQKEEFTLKWWVRARLVVLVVEWVADALLTHGRS